MAITKNRNRIRVKGGNNCFVKFGETHTWGSVGMVNTGKLTDKGDTVECTFPDNTSLELDGKNKCTFELVLAQSSKEEIELADKIKASGLCELYYYNGIVDGKHQEIYFPEMLCTKNLELELEGGKLQAIKMSFSAAPQDENASCTPDTDLPPDKKASGTVAIVGANQYYVVLETQVTQP